MSISDKIQALEASRQAIATAIAQKGGTVAQGDGFSQFATEISNLPSGGSGNPVITSIDVSDFSGTTFNRATSYITDVTIPSGVRTIGMYAFQETGLTTITIPSSVTTIGSYAFYQSKLTSITIPSTVTNLGLNVFQYCRNLTSITLPNNITVISAGLLSGCSNLASFTISETVTTIQNSAFEACGLTTITIPSSVTTIGYAVFQSCSRLTRVIVNATTPPTLDANVFNITNNCPIYVPAESVEAYKAATGWSTYADRIQAIPEDVKPAFKFTSSVDSSKDITVNCEDTETAGTLTANDLGMSSQQIDEFRSAENTGSVEIGDCVKIYMAAACYTAKGISEVKLNEGLERIGDFAFGGMSALREITIPSTVTNISYQAFYADRALEGITCLATTPPTLGSDVFGDTNNCPIFVQSESVDTYKTAWSQYADRIQALPAE